MNGGFYLAIHLAMPEKYVYTALLFLKPASTAAGDSDLSFAIFS